MMLLPFYSTLFSSVCNGLLGRYLGHRGAVLLSVLCMGIAFISSVTIWIQVCMGGCDSFMNVIPFHNYAFWFGIGTFNVCWKFHVDLVCSHMLLTVCSVSFAVHCYALVYMRNDAHLSLFMSYLSLFTFFMVVLVCSHNLIGMLVGWEGIGICSYLLIGYWGHRLSAIKSAQKAIIVNRVSDGLLLYGVLLIWWYTGTLNYDVVNLSDLPYVPTLLSVSLLIGAMGKSAQILFHVWLADAMEGPTPVSALIHAATLVTAGVYLMVRLNMLYSDLILIIGALTSFMAGIFGYFQNDLKRVIAFSTCSQLGYMMVSVGLGSHGADASMCHLMTHASFKAALFLGAGVIITSANGNQHMGRYGGVQSSVFSYVTLAIGCVCLMGIPESSGFYSKETIINLSYVCYNPLADFAHTLLILSVLITCTYTVKLFIQCFYYDYSNHTITHQSSTYYGYLITVAFTVLIIDVICKIYVGTNLLAGILYFVPWFVKTLPFGLLIAGVLTATVAYSSINFALLRFCATRWGFDQLYARMLVNTVLHSGFITFRIADKGLLVM